jgi:Flp pilus assembly protein TadG
MAILAAGMIAMAGLVIDGGNALATKEKAADVAEQAARAGADALSPESLRNGSPDQLRADPVAARKAANAIMTDNGATGTVTFDGNTVTVRATIPKKTAVLSVVHLNDISQTATWSATAIHGTTVAGN